MNPLLKQIIEFAIEYKKSVQARDAALDEIYVKLLVTPLQRAWRSKLDTIDCSDVCSDVCSDNSLCPNYACCDCGLDHD